MNRHQRTKLSNVANARTSSPLAGVQQAEAEAAAYREAERELLGALDQAWNRNWLPGEVIRQVARSMSAGAGRLVATAIVADHAGRPADAVHPRWAAHLRALDLPPLPDPTQWLADYQRREAMDAAECIRSAQAVARLLGWLHSLGVVIAPPGSAPATSSITDRSIIDTRSSEPRGLDIDPVLDKVRALLAQAESTTFEAEAETFTAKAQELMARYAIDAALLWDRSSRHDEPLMIRIPIDEPYIEAKNALLHVVAQHSRCRSIYYRGYALAVVVGFDSDLAATETLYTSLLVQAQIALQHEAAGSQPRSHSRSRTFRSSFLLAYSHRIDQRLAEVNTRVQNEMTAHGGATDLLPVLADRNSLIDAKIKAELGPTGTSRSRPTLDHSGWNAGARAADQAHLGQDELHSRPALAP